MAIGLNVRSLPPDTEVRAAAEWAIEQGIAVEDNTAPVTNAVISDLLEQYRAEGPFSEAAMPANGGATRLEAGITPRTGTTGPIDTDPDIAELTDLRPLAENPMLPFGLGLRGVARVVTETLDSVK